MTKVRRIWIGALAISAISMISWFYWNRYIARPWSIQEQTFGRVITGLTDVPAYTRFPGFEIHEQWSYTIDVGICRNLQRDYGCAINSAGNIEGFKCANDLGPGPCIIKVVPYTSEISTYILVDDGQLIILLER